MTQLFEPTTWSSPLKAFVVLAVAEPWLNMCVNLGALHSFKHQLVFSLFRGAIDVSVIAPTLAGIINSNTAVAAVSKEVCPWIHSVISCTTPWQFFTPAEHTCATSHATYNLVVLAIVVGHRAPLLLSYWHELQVKMEFPRRIQACPIPTACLWC
jgi:hypothetical protein